MLHSGHCAIIRVQFRFLHAAIAEHYKIYTDSIGQGVATPSIFTEFSSKCLEKKDFSHVKQVWNDNEVLGFPPSSKTIEYFVAACSHHKDIRTMYRLYSKITTNSWEVDTHTLETIITFFCRAKQFNMVDKVINFMLSKHLAIPIDTFSFVIRGYTWQNDLENSMKVFEQAAEHNREFGNFDIERILDLCTTPQHGVNIWDIIRKSKSKLEGYSLGILVQYLSKHKQYQTVLEIFDYLENQSVAVDQRYYCQFISACTAIQSYTNGATVIQSLLRQHSKLVLQVHSVLIKFYRVCGKFDKAWAQYERMIEENVTPNETVFTLILSACADAKQFELGTRVMSDMNVKRDIPLYTAIISFYVQCGEYDLAAKEYKQMISKGVSPNARMATVMLSACADQQHYGFGQDIIDSLPSVDVQLQDTIIKFYTKCGLLQRAIQVYENSSITPTEVTYILLLNACTRRKSDYGLKLYRSMPEKYLQEGRVSSVLITMLATLMYFNEAEQVFNSVHKKDVVVWTAMINAYGIKGDGNGAIRCYESMLSGGFTPDVVTFVTLIIALSHAHMYKQAHHVYRTMARYNIVPSEQANTSLIDAYARAGKIDEAVVIAQEMNDNTLATWIAILGACRNQKNLDQGVYVANKLFQIDKNYPATYVLLIKLYSEQGLHKQANQVRTTMRDLNLKKIPGITSFKYEGEEVQIYAQRLPVAWEPFTDKMEQWREEFITRLESNGYKVQTSLVGDLVDEKEAKKSLCGHSEKTGLVFLLNRSEGPIRMYKNLRICDDCHNATVKASQLYNREIFIQDARRTHHFKDGKCDCGGSW
jgi:pentatricopeptide repeat protein